MIQGTANEIRLPNEHAEQMLKKRLTEVILRTGGTASRYFRIYQWLACQLMELSTLSARLPGLTLKQELLKEEFNLWSVTKGVQELQQWSPARSAGVWQSSPFIAV